MTNSYKPEPWAPTASKGGLTHIAMTTVAELVNVVRDYQSLDACMPREIKCDE